MKVASVIAVGCNPYTPFVTPGEAQWAIDFVRRSVRTVESRFDKGEVGGGESSKAEQEICRVIEEFFKMAEVQRAVYKTPKSCLTGKVFTHGYLRARLKGVQPFKGDWRIFDSTLKTLLDTGTLQQLSPQQMLE